MSKRSKNRGVSGRKKPWAIAMRQLPCHYCGVTPAGTIDHVIPLSKGGSKRKENCVPACEPCNQARAPRRASQSWNLAEKYAAQMA